jgi:hypothetical protein
MNYSKLPKVNIDQDTDQKLRYLVEGGLSWDDRFVHTLSRIVSQNLLENTGFWLVERMLECKSKEDIEKYKYLAFNVGYYSDGFSEDFLNYVNTSIQDDLISSEIIGAVVDGILRAIYYCRGESVFQKLHELCRLVESGEFAKKLKHVTYKTSNMRDLLTRRSLIYDKYRNGEIVIPTILLEAMFSGTTNVSKRFISMFMCESPAQRVTNAMLNIWADKGPWDFLNNPLKEIHHSKSLVSSTYEYEMYLEVEWQLNDSVYYVSRSSVSSELPIPRNDEWVGVS